MSSYVSILKKKESILARLDSLIEESLATSTSSKNAQAIVIQRYVRGSKLRAILIFLTEEAAKIERVYRGHCGRKKVKNAKMKRSTKREDYRNQYFAVLVQKTFRGYRSRKYKENHARRKRLLQEVIDKGDEVRRTMYQYAVDQAIREEQERTEKASLEFKNIAENLHHLLSTKHRRGVYNPPEEFLETPTVDNIPVEDHIRGVVKDLLRTKGIQKTGLVKDFNGTLKIPLKLLKSKLSLQASAPYDAVKNEERRQTLMHKILSTNVQDILNRKVETTLLDEDGIMTEDIMHKIIEKNPNKFFVTGGKTDVINHKHVPLNTGDAYVDAWANPMLIRGVPESEEQLRQSAYHRKALFATAPAKPFIISSGGNLSAVHPTDFDLLADAQTTGGSSKRHISVTKRYGVPDNADYRPRGNGNNVPSPPKRATAHRLYRPKVKAHRVPVRPLSLRSREGYRPPEQEPDDLASSDEDE